MTSSDAARWDSRYLHAEAPTELRPPEIVSTHLSDLSAGASVLDIACGWGDAGLFLASRGASTTLMDLSTVALTAASQRASELDLSVAAVAADLTVEPVRKGPWDVIICTHYLDRELLPRLGEALKPGGRLVCAIATMTNLERHERPSARFLLQPGELATLVPELEVTHESEEWRANDVHEAWLVATR